MSGDPNLIILLAYEHRYGEVYCKICGVQKSCSNSNIESFTGLRSRRLYFRMFGERVTNSALFLGEYS